MGVLLLVRQGVLGVTAIFSVIELALAAHLISESQQYFNLTLTYCALGVAVSVISLVTLPVMLIVDLFRRGAFTSMIVVELAWLFTLCILWVAAAGQTVSDYNRYFPFGCDTLNSIYNGACQQTQALQAFSFLNFVIIYVILLLVMAGIAATKGQGVWLSSVKEAFGPSADPVQYPMSQHRASAAPQPQAVQTPAEAQKSIEHSQPGGVV